MTSPRNREWWNPETLSREIGCTVESLKLWQRDGEAADIPSDEKERLRSFLDEVLRPSACNLCVLAGPRSPPPVDPQEERRRRLDKQTAARAKGAGRMLLTFTMSDGTKTTLTARPA
jgi:hypothetical protein